MTAVEISKTVKASPELVYHALSNSEMLQQWFSNFAEFQARPEGRFYAHWNEGYYVAGAVKGIKENEEVAFTWFGMGDPGETKVRYVLEAKGDNTVVTVLHSNLGEGEAWDSFKKNLIKEWENSLENLAYLMEKKVDRRVFERPFLGILLTGQIDEEAAKELNLPEAKGIRISGTVDGTGAAEADLQSDDVLISLGGHDTSDFPGLGAALDASKAGETVDVELYRAGKKKTVPLLLSRRPAPDLPTTPKALADAMRTEYAKLGEELDALLDGVSDAEASQRPAEREWSVKENLAHLLMNEYWAQMRVTTVAGGGRTQGYTNDLGTVAAMANTLGDVHAMADLFKRNMQASIEAIAALPEPAASRPYVVHQLAQWVISPLGMPNHTRSHYTQIQETLATIREKVAS